MKYFLSICLVFFLTLISFSQTTFTTLTTSGTFTVPCGITSVTIQCWGAGGGGGGGFTGNGDGGGGGGGGGFTQQNSIVVTSAASITFTIGAGGTAGAAQGNGGTGGTTRVVVGATTITAAGGGGGGGNTTGTAGAAGIAGVGGTFTGGIGGVGTGTNSGGGGEGASSTAAGVSGTLSTGGTSAGNGGDGAAGTTANADPGSPGNSPGGGGSGGTKSSIGGVGGAGQVIIIYATPVASNAGSDQSICTTTTNLAGNTAAGFTGAWTCVTNCGGVSITTPASATSGVTGLVNGVSTTFQWKLTETATGCQTTADAVNVRVGPCNDNCANAIALTFTGTTASATGGSNLNATNDVTACGAGNTVWYKFTAVGHTASITVTGTGGTKITSPCIGIVISPTLCSLTGAYTAASTSAGTATIVSMNLVCALSVGKIYYVVVDNGATGAAGDFSITVSNTSPATIPNDDIDVASVINTCGANFNGTTIGATRCGDCPGQSSMFGTLYNDLDCNTTTDKSGAGGEGEDVAFSVENSSWYTFCVTAASTYTINFTNTGSCTGADGLQIAIFRGSANNLVPIAGGTSGMNILSGGTFSASAAFAAGECALIMVDGYAGTNCNYALSITPSTTCGILPVEIVSFDGSLTTQNIVLLSWKVATEENIKRYGIQKSIDGINFKTIGFVNSSNQTNSNYSFEDKDLDKGIYYYRLVIYENDGSEKVHGRMIALSVNKLDRYLLSPNPAFDKLNIEAPEGIENIQSFEMYNSNGVNVKSLKNLKAISQSFQIETGGLTSGIYLIIIENNGIVIKKKAIIEN